MINFCAQKAFDRKMKIALNITTSCVHFY